VDEIISKVIELISKNIYIHFFLLFSILAEIMPLPSDQLLLQKLRSAISKMHSFGLIGVHDAGVTPNELKFYKKYIYLILFFNEVFK